MHETIDDNVLNYHCTILTLNTSASASYSSANFLNGTKLGRQRVWKFFVVTLWLRTESDETSGELFGVYTYRTIRRTVLRARRTAHRTVRGWVGCLSLGPRKSNSNIYLGLFTGPGIGLDKTVHTMVCCPSDVRQTISSRERFIGPSVRRPDELS